MADDRAIAATSLALRAVLQAAGDAANLGSAISYDVASTADLQTPLGIGQGGRVWIYLYAVREDPTAGGGKPPAAHAQALTLHYLVVPVTVWWGPGQLLLRLAIRALHETPVLTAAMLNAPHGTDPVFAPNERVDVAWEPLSTADLAAIWAVAPDRRQPSASYVARLRA